MFSEHDGLVAVPLVGHYKHLGGHVVRGGTKLPEIQIRAAAARQNIVPLEQVLSHDMVSEEQKRVLVRSLDFSVLRLHSSTWFAMNQGEADAWAAALFRTYQMLESRTDKGDVKHKELYQLAAKIRAPMPVEMLYLEQLRLFAHLFQVFDVYVITAVLHNHRLAGEESWLHGVIMSIRWAQSQVGKCAILDELLGIAGWQCWHDLQDAACITHLLGTIIANSDVECILRAKAPQLYLTGMGR